ncbi:hypothetical protein ACIF6H_36480 [Streptomyces microflavus]|uniref:hypothetical protein n=1 Tax=Streptomyces TaxID=1883 RepID=UPI00117F3760|nr:MULTISPECIES: hypothetical protein [unclassified Streptomyces]
MSLFTDTPSRQMLCASNQMATDLEEVQCTVQEGPCITAAETGEQTHLTDWDAGARQWPLLTANFGERHPEVHAVHPFPLWFGRHILGSVDVATRVPWGLKDDAIEQAVDAVAAALLPAQQLLLEEEKYPPWEPGDVPCVLVGHPPRHRRRRRKRTNEHRRHPAHLTNAPVADRAAPLGTPNVGPSPPWGCVSAWSGGPSSGGIGRGRAFSTPSSAPVDLRKHVPVLGCGHERFGYQTHLHVGVLGDETAPACPTPPAESGGSSHQHAAGPIDHRLADHRLLQLPRTFL